MGLFLPDKEIKDTLSNANALITEGRQVLSARVDPSLAQLNSILDDLKAISGALRAIFERQ